MSIQYTQDLNSINTGVLILNQPGKLFQVSGTNTQAVELWIQFFNLNAEPVDTDIPFEVYLIQPSSNFCINFIGDRGQPGRYLDAGIGAAYSTTQDVLTLPANGGTLFTVCSTIE